MGAEGFHGRVRDGIGCWAPRYGHQVDLPHRGSPGAGAPGLGLGVDVRAAGEALFLRERGGRPGPGGLVPGARRLGWPLRGDVPLFSLGVGDQVERAISTGRLHALPRVHPRPIDVMVYHGSSGTAGLEGGFPLRCFQRLSRPHLATRRCRWRDNRSTRGASIPVLSY